MEAFKVFIGYDKGEEDAYRVCKESLPDYASIPVSVTKLDVQELQRCGLYRRPFWVTESGQKYDGVDGKPFSTEFSFSRFLTPAISLWQGWSLFMDSDFLWRADVAELYAERDSKYAVQVVQHEDAPSGESKMRGELLNPRYNKKNWSSLMLFNCEHEACKNLTTWQINFAYGYELHQFRWLDGSLVGKLSPDWNYLEQLGNAPEDVNPKAVHFTLGTPDIPQYADSPFAGEWLAWWGSLNSNNAA